MSMATGALLPSKPLTPSVNHRRLFPGRPTITISGPPTTTSLSLPLRSSPDYWASANADIQAHLERAIQIRHPLAVSEPMRHLTFSAPETTAPALCLLACELVGGSRDQAVAAGSALRLVHAAASAHEGLLSSRPRTDGPNFGPNIELLTGDGLTPFGFELLARSEPDHSNPTTRAESSSRVLRAIIEIARASGSHGMVEARYNEIEMIDGSGGDDEEWVERVCKKKEGEIHACAGACGAILGGGGEEEIERLRRYGVYVGMIRGIVAAKRVGRGGRRWLERKVGELRELGLNELKGFNREKVEPIASLMLTSEHDRRLRMTD
ncbi:unnamed protein product [Linum trigynum]|uniref:Uncharacterized protein n=1 Tax=Linum trigynum TaxID=586398 RepID=A0AAV2EFN3_9ROSI